MNVIIRKAIPVLTLLFSILDSFHGEAGGKQFPGKKTT